MKFSAHIENSPSDHQITLRVEEKEQSLSIAPKPSGGSTVSGGELLFLALATCYCNDLYREAAKRGITLNKVAVEVEGDFEAEGKPASNIAYRARVDANADEKTIHDLLLHTDTVAEIQNTLRAVTPIRLEI
ncbi:MAG: OsmC family protein [Anaerolineales bacterium]